MKLKKAWLFFALIISYGVQGSYKYSVDPKRAEEILAHLAFRPRLVEKAWIESLGANKDRQYHVQAGDTLWGISKKKFGDPWLWRKLWEENGFLGNPHELEPGQILSYNSKNFREIASADFQIPIIFLKPPGIAYSTDLDDDRTNKSIVKNQIQLNFLLVDEDEVLGEVVGAYKEFEKINSEEIIYLKWNAEHQPSIGQHFTIIRFNKDSIRAQSVTHSCMESLANPVANVKVVSVSDKLIKAEVELEFDELQREDKIMAIIPMVEIRSAVLPPPENLTLRVITGEFSHLRYLIQGSYILLEGGSEDGVQEGQAFRAIRDKDPFTKNHSDVEQEPKAEVQIVQVKPHCSIAYVNKMKEPILPKDLLVAHQLFPEPPPKPKRQVQTLLLK